ncbi:protein mono-ADP-ribosyltransferase PARP3-like [Lineus longissimus]|uniref:protein mono-ADP-ribosyltransferase PARP3-like n=1 Tax=Lineus longissimus TaxID=88925 RepID=UPI002B4C6227
MPKRKRTSSPSKGPGGKKAKTASATTSPPPATTTADIVTTLKTDTTKKKFHKPDEHCKLTNVEVYEDYDCMLNLTNIGKNNNKYYVIQVLKLKTGDQYHAWMKWGRVGEVRAHSLKGPFSSAQKAVDLFVQKFNDKTKNEWADRDSFVPVKGKYTLLEMADDNEEEDAKTHARLAGLSDDAIMKPCSLDKETQRLLNLIFDNNMFKDAMKKLDLDVKKMPLGKLSKHQIAKGYECLEELESVLKAAKPNRAKLTELSSRFYTLVPHNFGRRRPPVIEEMDVVQSKYDMLAVLGDIEIAQGIQKKKHKTLSNTKSREVLHPLDINYGLLGCDLELMDKESNEYKMLETYCEATQGYRKVSVDQIWAVNRHPEVKRFAVHDKIVNRKLLWHGTNVAVVAAILEGGLRIMPHSGGRVGRGIYFASENGKSAAYVRTTTDKKGIMFLTEVALGNEQHITRDNSSLTEPPSGKDSVIAKGWTEPDPAKDKDLVKDGKKIVVPQGEPVKQDKYVNNSSFGQSEYLVYKESQARMRYLILGDFSY